MTFNQLVLKNLVRNLKHYALYLFSVFFSIVLYFSFSTLQFTHDINNDNAITIIRKGSLVGSVFLFMIIIIFLMYANYLFIKRRTQEFALFQLTGLTRHHLLKMLSLEQIVFFIVTGIIGVVSGLAFSKLLLTIVTKVMKITTHLTIHFEPMALLLTFVMLIIAYLLIMIQSALFLKRRTILTLLKDQMNRDAVNPKVGILEALSGVIGVVMLILGYYMAVEMFGTFKALTLSMTSPFIILFLTVVGTYLFFRSSVSLIFKTLKNFKKGRINITDVVFTSSMMYRMKKNAMSLTIIATISAVTMSVLCFATLSQANAKQTMASYAPNDFNTSSRQQAQQLEQRLNKAHIAYHKHYTETLTIDNVKDNVVTLENGSDAGRTSSIVSSNKQVHGNQAVVTNIKALPNVMRINTNASLTLKGQHNLTVKAIHKDNTKVYPINVTMNSPVIEISPHHYQHLKAQLNNQDKVNTFYGFNIVHASQMSKASQLAQQITGINSAQKFKQQIAATNGMLIFVTSFLGLAFLIAAGCIIYIKQIDETEDELDNFKILQRLGFSHSDMFVGLLLKVTFNFGLPLIIALLHSIFAAIAFMKLMGQISFASVIIVIISYTVVYMLFAIIAFLHSNRVIKRVG
ncbi:FtsX-like permease family protein [Staphylococcus simiae]|uniref:ABC transporter permease n=1 Tax=Staphylococcus simiae TaxID=308354 RepID=UPI001A9673C8|nr:ABC transporter permease [Staphylococcus simiae]MBO1198225.1 FtsX-like permease family protein [Staphylococcus simiae]MBO1200940.1 FtsX-like permease family protein [Staphylococcus simiae]MBO1203099.1 FtsX-like permease family protein [Staphylococcus simiae]MBO1210217.1 FtsX-like permease family protein [Staphylococcus simiae]MBO1229278.1 FtsX-like permease family protein [Staphylococcus simiae]